MSGSSIKTIVVCGAGTMGAGIAQAAAQAGFSTILFDMNAGMLEKAFSEISKSLEFLVQKQKISKDEKLKSLNRISYTAFLEKCLGDLVIEAIVEIADIKKSLFLTLNEINKPDCLFASNTSSLSITDLQTSIPYPERFAGMHFFNPANIMKLVEIVKGKYTTDKTVHTLTDVAIAMGKTPVQCKDSPGFIVNHVARTYYLEAMHLVEKGYATIETIDEVMEATGFKMGPFKLMDLIGMDINYKVSCQVWEALGKPERLKPSNLQKTKVEQGALGKKTGKGFYAY